MAVRQYIGARYVIKIYENSNDPSSAEWEANTNYEYLTLVTYNYGSYLSKKNVPANISNPVDNPEYWVQTGFYSGQIADLQNQVDIINEALKEIEYNTGNSLKYYSSSKVNIADYVETLSGDVNYYHMQGCAYNSNTGKLIMAITADDEHGMLIELSLDYTTVNRRKIFSNGEIAHGNDITYNPKTNKLYIAGYTEVIANEENCLMEIDADTLDFVRKISLLPATTVPAEVAGKVAYDPENDIYYTASNETIRIYDNNFVLQKIIPFDYLNIITNSYGLLNDKIEIFQAMEFYNNKLALLLQSNSAQSPMVVLINPDDGSVFNTIIPEGINGSEPEGLFLASNYLHVVYSYPTYAVVSLIPQTDGVVQNGNNMLTPFKTIPNGTDINVIRTLGYYFFNSAGGATVVNGPTNNDSFSLFVVPFGGSISQIAYNERFLALRTIIYDGTFGKWIYLKGVKTNSTISDANVIVPGFISDGGASIYFMIPINFIEGNTISISSFYGLATSVDGALSDGVHATNIDYDNLNVQTVQTNSLGAVIKIDRKDGVNFSNSTNTPVAIQFWSINYTIS